MLDAVYIDTRNNLIVAIKPKPPFRPVFQVAASREKSVIRIINEPLEGSSLFLVETGETPSLPETPLEFLLLTTVNTFASQIADIYWGCLTILTKCLLFPIELASNQGYNIPIK